MLRYVHLIKCSNLTHTLNFSIIFKFVFVMDLMYTKYQVNYFEAYLFTLSPISSQSLLTTLYVVLLLIEYLL